MYLIPPRIEQLAAVAQIAKRDFALGISRVAKASTRAKVAQDLRLRTFRTMSHLSLQEKWEQAD